MTQERWLLHAPAREGELSGVLLVLWHGAGGDIDQKHMIALSDAVAARGGHAARARFGYRIEGKRMPDRMPKLVDSARETIRMLAEELGEKRLFLGGRSMGGRVASMLVAEGEPADGLVFLSYPLHPAKQPEKLRDRHLYQIPIPMLFATGDRDALADMKLLRGVIEKLGHRATLEVWKGSDHSFRKVDPDESAERIVRWMVAVG